MAAAGQFVYAGGRHKPARAAGALRRTVACRGRRRLSISAAANGVRAEPRSGESRYISTPYCRVLYVCMCTLSSRGRLDHIYTWRRLASRRRGAARGEGGSLEIEARRRAATWQHRECDAPLSVGSKWRLCVIDTVLLYRCPYLWCIWLMAGPTGALRPRGLRPTSMYVSLRPPCRPRRHVASYGCACDPRPRSYVRRVRVACTPISSSRLVSGLNVSAKWIGMQWFLLLFSCYVIIFRSRYNNFLSASKVASTVCSCHFFEPSQLFLTKHQKNEQMIIAGCIW